MSKKLNGDVCLTCHLISFFRVICSFSFGSSQHPFSWIPPHPVSLWSYDERATFAVADDVYDSFLDVACGVTAER